MDKDIITQILETSEHIDLAFEIEEKIGLLKTAIIDEYRISLVEQLKSGQWIVFENLDFGKAEEHLVFFKAEWKHQFELYFEQPYSDLRLGITPQFQTDIDKNSDALIQQKLSKLPYLDLPVEKYWTWLASMGLSDFSWREIYEGSLTKKTLSEIDEICKLAEMAL
jgi:hypothetical protein